MKEASFYQAKPILSLQTMLRLLSTANPHILPVIPDGLYGSNTYASVLSFQEASALPVTGETNLDTWNKIVAAFDDALPHLTAPMISPMWSTSQSVLPGQSNYHLYLVQAMLAALAQFFPVLPTPSITGELDSTTQQGLRWVQLAAGLEENGALDTATWNYLTAIYRAIVKDGKIE